MSPESKNTESARRRYNRIAPLYDFMEGLVERSNYAKWRRLMWSEVEGTRILEIGVGTGKNFPYYPKGAEITAVDFSDRMLSRAREKAKKQGIQVHLEQMDAQDLRFDDNSFDTVLASFVFCSVPEPVQGLKEVERVCKPGGKVILLEHVLSANRILAWFMNLSNPIVVRVLGANINRRTVDNVDQSGLVLEHVTNLALGIFLIIESRKQKPSSENVVR
jgi:ubiquinone/menaquinone biosynthesis C-methylase UbiE